MTDKVGEKEQRLRELALQTRAGKNARAKAAEAPIEQTIKKLRADVAKVAAKKSNRRKKKGKRS
jgi:hypothetical protein